MSSTGNKNVDFFYLFQSQKNIYSDESNLDNPSGKGHSSQYDQKINFRTYIGTLGLPLKV